MNVDWNNSTTRYYNRILLYQFEAFHQLEKERMRVIMIGLFSVGRRENFQSDNYSKAQNVLHIRPVTLPVIRSHISKRDYIIPTY